MRSLPSGWLAVGALGVLCVAEARPTDHELDSSIARAARAADVRGLELRFLP